jgi:hypothetical protein
VSKEELDQMITYLTRKYAEVLRELARYEKEEKERTRLYGKTPVGESSVQEAGDTKQKEGED